MSPESVVLLEKEMNKFLLLLFFLCGVRACPPGARGAAGQDGCCPVLNPLAVSIVPLAANTLTLGTAAKPFADSYANNSHVTKTLTVGGPAIVASLNTGSGAITGATLTITGATIAAGPANFATTGTVSGGAATFTSGTISGNLNVAHNITGVALKLTAGAHTGYLLTSDSQGNAQWKPPAAPSGGAQNSTFGNGIKVFGASSIAGPLTLSGNIKFDADATRDIGSKLVRANAIYTKYIHVNNTEDGSPSIFAGAIAAKSLATTGSITISSAGTLTLSSTLTNNGGLTSNSIITFGGIGVHADATIAGALAVGGTASLSGALLVDGVTNLDGGKTTTDGLGNFGFNFGATPFGLTQVTCTATQILAMDGSGPNDCPILPSSVSGNNYYVVVQATLSTQGQAATAYTSSGTPALQLFSWDGVNRIALTSATDWPFSIWKLAASKTIATIGLTGTAFTTSLRFGAMTLGLSTGTPVTTGNFNVIVSVMWYSSPL